MKAVLGAPAIGLLLFAGRGRRREGGTHSSQVTGPVRPVG